MSKVNSIMPANLFDRGDLLIEVRTKVGKMTIDHDKIELVHTGFVGALYRFFFDPIFSLFFNMDKVIPIKSIDKVTYHKGKPYITKPAIVIHYGGKKKVVAFKHISQMFDYEGAKKELDLVLDYLRKLNIKVEEDNSLIIAWR
jgi:hypothetical protein